MPEEKGKEQNKKDREQGNHGQDEGVVLKHAEGGAGIAATNYLEEPGTKYRIPLGIRPGPRFGQLVSNSHQDGREEKEHIPPAALGKSDSYALACFALQLKHRFAWGKASSRPGSIV